MEFQSYRGGLLYSMVSGCFEWSFNATEGVCFTAAGVGPCGGPKKSPRTSSIVQIIFFF